MHAMAEPVCDTAAQTGQKESSAPENMTGFYNLMQGQGPTAAV